MARPDPYDDAADRAGRQDAAVSAPDRSERWLTVPNAISVLRLMATPVMLVLAWHGERTAFVVLLAALLATDWIDGRLAALLNQRTTLGARLDSLADVLLYTALAPCAWWLRPDFMRSDALLLAAVATTYLLTSLVSVVRFGRLPSYHTLAAKVCLALAAIGAVVLFAGGSLWPVRIAMAVAIATNLEATAISLVLRGWLADVPSLVHALRRRA
jgi:CDP-diacylglycerol--glycerol-3-phosphate 3-phosphatidyltransferase